MTAVEVNRWLQRRYRFQAPVDWLEACCAWLNEESNGSGLTLNELRSQVLSQWLISDLREVGMSSLPAALNQQPKVLLEGSYCLQVNAAYDASTSFYSQLQKLSGAENENVHVSATQNSQTQQPESGRLLMFEMTDGVQSIRGMEYRRLPAVDDGLTPGAKVVVSGPVLCRRGVLMLEPRNWMLLGGEVDTLTENSGRVSVLQRRLASNRERMPMEMPRCTFSPRESSSRRDRATHDDATTGNDDVDDFMFGLDISQLEDWDGQADDLSNGANRSHDNGVTRDDKVRANHPSGRLSASNHDGGVTISGPATTERAKSEGCVAGGSMRILGGATDPSMAVNTSCDVGNHNRQGTCSHVASTPHAADVLWDDDDDDEFETLAQALSEPVERNCGLLNEDEQFGAGTDNKHDCVEGAAAQMGRAVTGREQTLADVTLLTVPYTYLLLVKKEKPSGQCVVVKAFVSTLLGRLEHNGGRHWSLAVKLNDGTASLDVDLDDGFLASLIGFSASECHAMRLRARTCGETRSRIARGIGRCQQSLIQLYGLIRMRLISGRQHPLVVGCSAITEFEVQELKSRISLR